MAKVYDEEKDSFYKGSNAGASAEQLKQQEQGVESGSNPTADQAGSEEQDTLNKTGFYNPGDKGGGGILGKIKKNKKPLMLLGIPGVIIFIIIIILILFISSLKIPDLAQNITNYEFARVTRQFSQSADRTTEEALAVESADDSTTDNVYGALKAKFSSIGDNTWGRLDKYRPSKVIETLGNGTEATTADGTTVNLDDGLNFHFTTSKLTGREILQYGEIGGEKVEMEQVGGLAKWVPVLSQIKTIQNEADFVSQMKPLIEDGLDTYNTGLLIRVGVAAQLRKELNVSLTGLILGLFKDSPNDPAKALLEETRDKEQYIDDTSKVPDNAVTDEIKNAESDAKTEEAEAVSNDTSLEATINNDGVVPGVTAAIQKDTASTAVSTAVGFIDPLYTIATPVCIIYDGSVQQSGPTIDNQTAQQEAAYYFIASSADQQKNGSSASNDAELATAVQAENTDLGDVTQSNPYVRATGGTVDTTSSVSAEAGAGGTYDYSVFNALGLKTTTTGPLNDIFSSVCPALTSLKAAALLAAINLTAGVVTFGGSPEGQAALGDGIGAFVKAFATKTVNDIGGSLLGKATTKAGVKTVGHSAVSRAESLIFNVGKEGGKIAGIAGITILAHIVVAARAGQLNSGLAQGPDLANQADAGANIQQGEIERSQLFGRPLLENEVCASNQDDQTYVAYQESKQSTFDRYLSPSNADSMVSQSTIAADRIFSKPLGTSIAGVLDNIFTTQGIFGSLMSVFMGRSYAAANCNADSTDYGNVQFGWSDDEESLIDSNNSYDVLENQALLDKATNGGEAAIAQKYAICFGYQYNPNGDGTFDPTDSAGDLQLASGPGQAGSLGTLLSAGDIARDSDGNVINSSSALCSPENLSYNNNEFGPQMVFRWRLAMQYDTTLDQLTGEENVTN